MAITFFKSLNIFRLFYSGKKSRVEIIHSTAEIHWQLENIDNVELINNLSQQQLTKLQPFMFFESGRKVRDKNTTQQHRSSSSA